jgi:hypothetical protein
MHDCLKRQLEHHLGTDLPRGPAFDAFLEAGGAAYSRADGETFVVRLPLGPGARATPQRGARAARSSAPASPI